MPWGFFGGKMLEKRPTWAQRITEARGKKGISQRELVNKLGVYQTTIVSYEVGKREPRIGYLMGLIRETGVDGDWLLTGKGDMYGEEKKLITKEEAIKVLFGDKADEVVLYIIESIKDPFLRAILFTRASEYKEQHKDRYAKTGEGSNT
jgi:transcriptional regulator with XRE-family HTH domain